MQCVECGKSLPLGKYVCAPCSPPSSFPEDQVVEPFALVTRARGQLIIGSLFLPWVFGPLALQNTIKAGRLAAALPERDRRLDGQITRVKLATLVFSVLAYAFLIALVAR